MSGEKKDSKIYDLRKIEDLFECVEIVTMARGALHPVDERLASRLEKVSDALTAFSMNIEESLSSIQDNQATNQDNSEAELSGEKNGVQDPFDLLSDFPTSSSSRKGPQAEKDADSDEDDGIIDIVTGEKIK